MQSTLRSTSAVLFLALGFSAVGQANTITVTSGQAGGGVTLIPGLSFIALDVFGQQGNTNVVQGVTFTTSNPLVSIVQSTGAQANPGGGGAIGSFDGSVNPDDVALTNIDRSIIYGAQTITIGPLNPGQLYNVQLLTTDSGANERIEDFTINGVFSSTLDVLPGVTYNVNNNIQADTNGLITIAMTPNASSVDRFPVLAAVIVTSPEPSTFVLCGLGAAGLIVAARRRRKA